MSVSVPPTIIPVGYAPSPEVDAQAPEDEDENVPPPRASKSCRTRTRRARARRARDRRARARAHAPAPEVDVSFYRVAVERQIDGSLSSIKLAAIIPENTLLGDGSSLTSVSLSFEKSNEGGPDQELVHSEAVIIPQKYHENPQCVSHENDEDLEELCHLLAQGHFGHGLGVKGLLGATNGFWTWIDWMNSRHQIDDPSPEVDAPFLCALAP